MMSFGAKASDHVAKGFVQTSEVPHVMQFRFRTCPIEVQEELVEFFQEFVEKIHVGEREVRHQDETLDGEEELDEKSLAWELPGRDNHHFAKHREACDEEHSFACKSADVLIVTRPDSFGEGCFPFIPTWMIDVTNEVIDLWDIQAIRGEVVNKLIADILPHAS